MHRQLAALLVVVSLAAAACSAGSAGSAPPELAAAAVPRASADPSAAAAAASAVDAFGFDLYRRLAAPGRNVVVSPTSVVLALAMARLGARGETASQMDAVLHATGLDQAAALNALDAALAARSGTFPDVTGHQVEVALRIANAPFAQRDEHWASAFLEALAARFGAGVRLVDYRADPEAARRAIDAWVADRTEGRIPELLGAGALDALTRLVLVDAIYLTAPWAMPFVPGETADAPFRRADGSTVQVPTMRATRQLAYAAGDGWQAVELAYAGGSLAMTLVVPDDLAGFERTLDGARFAAIVAALGPREVQLALPRFGTETQVDLAAALGAMGMPRAFDPARADFGGMTADERLSISKVIHQANIDVDERGTEASAATAVALEAMGTPAEPVRVAADRPFLFAVRDVPTGAILFLGRIGDPSAR